MPKKARTERRRAKKKTTCSDLSKRVKVCTACRLSKTRTRAVPAEGTHKAKVMFVGIGPGRQEDEAGRPFVGQSGKWFDRSLKRIGLTREEVWVTNLVKCRPFEGRRNRDPRANELAACAAHLDAEFELVKPNVVVPLGNIPLKHLLGLDGITKKRGMCFFKEDDPEVVYFPLLHPAVLVRDKDGNLDEYGVDLRNLRRLLARLGIGKYGKKVREQRKAGSAGKSAC